MARPRKTDKAKGQEDAAKAQNLAADALLQFPTEIDKLKEEFVETPDTLAADKETAAAEMASARAAIKEHEKRQAKLYKVEPKTLKMLNDVRGLPDGRRQRVIRQFMFLVKQLGLDDQLDLFNDTAAAGGADPDEGSIFDKTGSGDKVSAERGDDPGRARKSVGGPPKAPAIPTPNVGVEGLAAGIKPLEDPEAKRARIEAEKKADAAAFEKPGAAKAEALDAEMKNMTPAQKRAHAKKIAEEVFAKQGNVGLGADGIH